MVSKLKDKAKRRKGRGFTGGRGEDRDEVKTCLNSSFFLLLDSRGWLKGKIAKDLFSASKVLCTMFLMPYSW